MSDETVTTSQILDDLLSEAQFTLQRGDHEALSAAVSDARNILTNQAATITRLRDENERQFAESANKALLDANALTDLRNQLSALREDLTQMSDAGEMLWVVLANVSGGDWTQQSA